MITPDGWRVRLLRFDEEPMFRVTCGNRADSAQGVVVSLSELISVLGDSFQFLEPTDLVGAAAPLGV